MVTQRPPRPRTLPGDDALLLHKIFFIPIFLGMAVVSLGLAMATAALDAREGQLWHLPWPIVQWALTTPLGILAVTLVGGLVGGLPLVVAMPALWGTQLAYAVDVTELPPRAWPASSPWRRPGGPTRGDYWLGRGRRERVLSLLALALALLLALGFVAAIVAAGWYGIAHLPDCGTSGCPPSFGLAILPPMFLSNASLLLGQYGWIRHVERRCGIWFRVPYSTCYIRRPGVTAEAAATALARYTRGGGRPALRRTLVAELATAPFLLVMTGLIMLGAWLPTHWIPN